MRIYSSYINKCAKPGDTLGLQNASSARVDIANISGGAWFAGANDLRPGYLAILLVEEVKYDLKHFWMLGDTCVTE